MSAPIAVSVTEAAAMVGLDASTVRKAVQTRDIPSKRVGRRVLVSVAGLNEWFDGLDDGYPASMTS